MPSYDHLFELDWLARDSQNARFRKTIKGGYRSPLGVQIHPYCFEIAKQKFAEQKLPYDRKKVEAAVETWIERSVEKVLGNQGGCSQRYPELNNFFHSWLIRARRAVFTCSPKNSKELEASAQHFVYGESLSDLPKEAVKGLDIKASESTVKSIKPTIVLASDTFLGVLEGKAPERKDSTFIHEIFHSTGANNQYEHNQVERVNAVSARDKIDVDSCETQIADDRVAMLAAMCSRSTVFFAGKTVEEVIYKRVLKCGPLKGCVAMMRDKDTRLNHLKSVKLSEAAAVSFCESVIEERACVEWAGKNIDEILKTNAEITNARTEVRERLEAVLPTKNHQIPRALLESIPGVLDKLNGKALASCVAAATVTDDQGALYPKTFNYLPQPELQLRGYAGSDSMWAEMKPFVTAIKAAPECREPETQARALKVFKMIGQEMRLALNAPAFKQLAFNAINEKPERVREAIGLTPDISLTSAPSMREGDDAKAFIRLLGSETYNKYLKALERFHPESTQLDCLNLGMRPHATIHLAKNRLELLQKMHQIEPSCTDSN